MSLLDKQQELRELLTEANHVMDKAKEIFFAARQVSNEILNAAHALNSGVVDEFDANGGASRPRRKRTTLTEVDAVLPTDESIREAAIERGVVPPVEKEFKRACGNCGKPGHRSKRCPQPPKNANVPMGKRACGKCRKPGHRQQNCPN